MVRSTHFDLQSLRLFLVVAELGSLTKAAQSTSTTLSAVSKRIADLERSIDCRLLLRLPRGIELTTAGRELLVHARQVVDRVNRMANEMGDYAVGVRGHVRVWANSSAIIQFLPQDLQAFVSLNLGVKISLEERLSDEIVAAICSNATDIGIFADNVPAPGMAKTVYRRDNLVLLVPDRHPLAEVREVAFVDTLDYEYVGLNEGSSLLARMFDAAFSVDRSLKIRVQVRSFDAICRMIEHGLGIGILPEAAVRNEILAAAGLRSLRLTDAWAKRTLWLGTQTREILAPEALRLFDFMAGTSGA